MIRNIYILLLLSLAIPCNDGEVELWGECYNIEETTFLDLCCSELEGEIPAEIGSLINLTTLYLYSNNLTGQIPVEIGNLINLNTLYLQTNQLSGEIPDEIGYLENLQQIHLAVNQLSGEVPESLCNIIDDDFQGLYLYENNLCPPYPECFNESDENPYIEISAQNTMNSQILMQRVRGIGGIADLTVGEATRLIN